VAEVALIVGAGPRTGGAIGRLAAAEGMQVALAARTPDRIAGLASEIGAKTYGCDATQRDQVDRLFAAVESDLGVPDLVVFNPAGRVAGAIQDIEPQDAERSLAILNGAFLVAQAASRGMIARGSGTIAFTGAATSVKAPAGQSVIAMYKFGIRGLAQALARELHPKGVHVGHVYVLGGIAPLDPAQRQGEDANALGDEIARAFLTLHRQHRSVWSWELGIGPWSGEVA
jgi:NAD(P)-dependent dehydrogenase (short-subunit alcohol dehydrogenase family)